MKKIISILLSTLGVITLAGCLSNSSPDTSQSEPPVSTVNPSASPSKFDIQEDIAEAMRPNTPAPTSEPSSAPTQSQTAENSQGDEIMPTINIQIGEKSFAAILYDNETVRTIVQEMPFALKMDDFASQEKVTDLTFDLPAARKETPATINTGDIYLWSGNSLVLFYTTFSNSYSYVPVGYIEDVTGLKDALGSGSVEVTFQKNNLF